MMHTRIQNPESKVLILQVKYSQDLNVFVIIILLTNESINRKKDHSLGSSHSKYPDNRVYLWSGVRNRRSNNDGQVGISSSDRSLGIVVVERTLGEATIEVILACLPKCNEGRMLVAYT
jgi:hypothetical protein